MARYKVEVLKSDDGAGNLEWTLAARRQQPGEPRRMTYGAAEFLGEPEADRLVDAFENTGDPIPARRVAHEPIATNGARGDALISVYELSTGSLVAETNGDPIYEQAEGWQVLPEALREQAEKNRSH